MADHDPFDDEQLVSSNTNQRNWRGILIALLVIVVVLALIVTSVVLLTPPDEGPRIKGNRFQLDDILSRDFQPLKFNGTWVSGFKLLCDISSCRNCYGCVQCNSEFHDFDNQSELLVQLRLNPTRFQLSPDQKYLLLATNVQKLFRHSYLAQYSIYDIQTGNDFTLRPIPQDDDHPFLLLAQWAPKGHALVMVQDYNIFYRKTPTSHMGYRVTHTAVPGVVSHGVPDWLYEEEILGTNSAIWMSRDGMLMVFASFNDSLVEELRFPWYGSIKDGRLYPDIRSLRYPKPGTRNPQVVLTVADLADTSNIKMKPVLPPSVIAHSDHYFTAVSWISSTEISVVWMNRPQNVSVITICSSPKWDCKETQRITSDGHGWVDMGDSPVFGTDSSKYITIAPVRDGPAGNFRHAVSVNIPKRRFIPLTHGRFEISRILTWDHSNDVIYFLGIPEGKPGQLHLYRVASVPPRTGASLPPPVCLTCVKEPTPTQPPFVSLDENIYRVKTTNWDDEDEEIVLTTPPTRRRRKKQKAVDKQPPCLYHNVIFSPNSAYYVLECLGPGIPTSSLYKTGMPKSKLLMWLQNNTELRERVDEMAMPQMRTFPVQISGGYQAQIRLHLPPGLREDEITRYPLIVQVYGGPGSQLVTERWRVDWNTYLSGNKDYIIAQIDGRGTGGQGHQILHKVYYKLGSVEVDDQLEVTEYLRDTQHFIDKRRVAVWGWSYGGFVAALALASSKKVFQCAIAVSPVTNWKLYDSAYTERFMGLPNVTDNYKGYDEADVSKKAEQLKDKMFYLIHGSADDNVHLQQSMALVRALSDAGTLFRQQIYPDETHNLGGVKRHLYESMGNFLEDCFKKQVPPEFKAGLRNYVD